MLSSSLYKHQMRTNTPCLLAAVSSLAALDIIASAQDLGCRQCRGGNRKCIADTSLQAISDDHCQACLKSGSKWTWPCSVEGLCWCWDSTKPKFKPALSSGYEEAEKEPCDLFTEEMFNVIAPNAQHPFVSIIYISILN